MFVAACISFLFISAIYILLCEQQLPPNLWSLKENGIFNNVYIFKYVLKFQLRLYVCINFVHFKISITFLRVYT